jgi:hypothetical protein
MLNHAKKILIQFPPQDLVSWRIVMANVALKYPALRLKARLIHMGTRRHLRQQALCLFRARAAIHVERVTSR